MRRLLPVSVAQVFLQPPSPTADGFSYVDKWVSLRDLPPEEGGWGPETPPPARPEALPDVAAVLRGVSAAPSDLYFPDPSHFIAGAVHRQVDAWRVVLEGHPQRESLLSYLTSGVRVQDFLQDYSGRWQGKYYSSALPPPIILANHPSLDEFKGFVEEEIKKGIAVGAMRLVGAVNDPNVRRPRLVQPLGVEPNKPRLIYDCRYLNLWCRHVPFGFDLLTDIPRLSALVGKFVAGLALDHASGYYHFFLSDDSEEFFGFEFGGFYYVYRVLPFGWNESPFIYQMFTIAVCRYLARLGIDALGYLDDVIVPLRAACNISSLARAYVVCSTFLSLGYFLQLRKSSLRPVLRVDWLGFTVDFERRCFQVTEKRLRSIQALIATILAEGSVNVYTLESLVGKLVHLRLAVQPAMLFVRGLYDLLHAHTSAASRGTHRFSVEAVTLTAAALADLRFWTTEVTLESARRFWFSDRHVHINIHTDSSGLRWGGLFDIPGGGAHPVRQVCDDVWPPILAALHINEKEAFAAILVLALAGAYLRDAVVMLFIDNEVLFHLLRGDFSGSSSPILNAIFIMLWRLQQRLGFEIRPFWIPSEANVDADAVSRLPRVHEYMISARLWVAVERQFGPHAVDIMSSAELTHCSFYRRGPEDSGVPLAFISRFLTPGALGWDVFRQQLCSLPGRCYCHPPVPLIPALLSLLSEQKARCTVVVQADCEATWWQGVQRFPSLVLATAGERGALFVMGEGNTLVEGPSLRVDLIAFDVDFSV